MGKKSGFEPGMNNPDHFSESLETILWAKMLKFLDVDPDPGSGIFFPRDPGWKKFGSGIHDKHPGSATTGCVPLISLCSTCQREKV
jgi:hypothetical protein